MRINNNTTTELTYCIGCGYYAEHRCEEHVSFIHHKDGNFKNNNINNIWENYFAKNGVIGLTDREIQEIFFGNNHTA